MWQPGSLIFDEEQAAVVLNDADDIIAAEGVYKYVTLAGGDTVRKPDTENGRLFAAAPDLLEALQALTEWGCTYTSPLKPNSPHDLLIAARDAISKATTPE